MKSNTYLNTFLLLVFALIKQQTVNAQINFYIKPTISISYHKGNNGQGQLISNQPFAPNPYFQFVNAGAFVSNSLNLGLHVGPSLNKKHFFQFGIENDNAGFANSVLINTKALYDTASYTNLFAGNDYTSIDVPYLRFNLQYDQIVWTQKNQIFNLRISARTGVLFSSSVHPKKNIYRIEELNAFAPGQIGDQIFITEHTITSTTYKRIAPFLSFGLGTDILTKKKNNYLFSFDIYYLQGLSNFISVKDRISVMDNGQRTDYNYFSSSKGSGFYIQLSRRFQVYPWKKNKERTL